jgi:hypothetical protein
MKLFKDKATPGTVIKFFQSVSGSGVWDGSKVLVDSYLPQAWGVAQC